MKNTDFNALAKRAYENAEKKGFHEAKRADGHYWMLVICEFAEAVEADRRGRHADRKEYERLGGVCEDSMRQKLFELYIKDTVEDELADAAIRLLDYMGMKGFDFNGFIKDPKNYAEEDVTEPTFFTEDVYKVLDMMNFDNSVGFVMLDVMDLAKQYGIDLMWHIQAKMAYNENRYFRHGKRY